MIKTLGKKINSLKKERKTLLDNIKAPLNHQENETIKRNIYNIKVLSNEKLDKNNCKQRRYNISNDNNI